MKKFRGACFSFLGDFLHVPKAENRKHFQESTCSFMKLIFFYHKIDRAEDTLENPRFYESLSCKSVLKNQAVLCLMYFPLGHE